MTEYINRYRPSQAEIDRRYSNIRAAMEKEGLDALVALDAAHLSLRASLVRQHHEDDFPPLQIKDSQGY